MVHNSAKVHKAVIVAGCRTPFVRAGAELKDAPAWLLGTVVTRELLLRSGIATTEIDEVIFGCVAQPADTANIARVIALRAGIAKEVPAYTVARNCASGLEAVTQAAAKIASGQAEVVLAGGVESMSRIPLHYPLSFGWKMAALSRARRLGQRLGALAAFRFADLKPEIALEQGLTDPVAGEIMGLTAERLVREFNISRTQQDEYALESHQRAVRARAKLQDETILVSVPPRFQNVVGADVGPRENQSLEALSRMRPYFDRRLGTVTIGNSCGITDGAAALLIMNETKALALGLTILGRIAGFAYRGCDPGRMGLGPVVATPIALRHAGVRFQDLRCIELNEAFAAQVLACRMAFATRAHAQRLGLDQALGEIDPQRLNPNGGAIALGHPVGATGTRLLLTLMNELRRTGGGFGLATMCIGGGQGGAVVIEGLAA
ncbi:MAG: thiolase family protein [Planctomycetota bacterium]